MKTVKENGSYIAGWFPALIFFQLLYNRQLLECGRDWAVGINLHGLQEKEKAEEDSTTNL